MQKELHNRVALITGASRGIGKAIAVKLAKNGASVAINYNYNKEAAKKTKILINSLGVRSEIFKSDISDPQSVSSLVNNVEKNMGPIDLLVTNAGVAEMEDPEKLDFKIWNKMISVNLNGTYLPVTEVIKGMKKRKFGRIVCISSIAGIGMRPQMIAYGTSKAAVIAFTRNISSTLAPFIRINAVAPGLIDTDMIQVMSERQQNAVAEATPMKRLGQPDEIAELTAFLLSERASFITGQCYVASGGRVTLP